MNDISLWRIEVCSAHYLPFEAIQSTAQGWMHNRVVERASTHGRAFAFIFSAQVFSFSLQ